MTIISETWKHLLTKQNQDIEKQRLALLSFSLKKIIEAKFRTQVLTLNDFFIGSISPKSLESIDPMAPIYLQQ